jgi:hypothetical protein
MKIRPLGDKLFLGDGQTDMTKLIAVFRNSANASKNGLAGKLIKKLVSKMYRFYYIIHKEVFYDNVTSLEHISTGAVSLVTFFVHEDYVVSSSILLFSICRVTLKLSCYAGAGC